ncbi:hypothetical protein ASG29_16150 [Sphingomonas sp. Leaf412]|uniref:NAD(P)H-hydrate dehydratase n=1 Tax=Sphingomonas sp. Leaf412 TaxID=1736370 RepID=UPI0006F85D4D|nr:NAD(P)H-hydrate dehydratase [Sphingomonas sp. Leaf412]KQT31032.1 hypothetical protein ASG29_16150 [Sphingomonas sp. Leaf412]
MNGPTQIDSAWIAANPVPVHDATATTKNSRGRVLVIGGSRMVPGALRLTGEAALRTGAGKLQMATVASAATGLGLLVPEAGVVALEKDSDGEINAGMPALLRKSLDECEALVVGPGIGTIRAAAALLKMVVDRPRSDLMLVIDALALGCAVGLKAELAAFAGRMVFTPHHGEMAMLTGLDERAILDDPARIAREVADNYHAVVVLKGSDTIIAGPAAESLHYGGGGTGLATAGSGDVLAGAIGGLLSRGATPLVAAGWGVWLHGQSGRRVATTAGPIGFLARELPPEFPRLLPQ